VPGYRLRLAQALYFQIRLEGADVIEVRIPMSRMRRDIFEVEAELEKGGMPPMGQRDGFVKSWHDVESDEFVYQFTPREEAMLPTFKPAAEPK
jgi:hypothetical protein